MSEGERFHEPRVRINRVYTRAGDQGETRLVGGQKVRKDGLRLEAYGTVDELNAHVGAATVSCEGLGDLAAVLRGVQHQLFNLGSLLATLAEDLRPQQPRVGESDVQKLEALIDHYNEELPALRSFVLPGGSRANTDLHLCRTVCRRAERICVSLSREEPLDPWAIPYLNRLSDAFFVWSRWAAVRGGAPEVLWTPNAT